MMSVHRCSLTVFLFSVAASAASAALDACEASMTCDGALTQEAVNGNAMLQITHSPVADKNSLLHAQFGRKATQDACRRNAFTLKTAITLQEAHGTSQCVPSTLQEGHRRAIRQHGNRTHSNPELSALIGDEEHAAKKLTNGLKDSMSDFAQAHRQQSASQFAQADLKDGNDEDYFIEDTAQANLKDGKKDESIENKNSQFVQADVKDGDEDDIVQADLKDGDEDESVEADLKAGKADEIVEKQGNQFVRADLKGRDEDDVVQGDLKDADEYVVKADLKDGDERVDAPNVDLGRRKDRHRGMVLVMEHRRGKVILHHALP